MEMKRLSLVVGIALLSACALPAPPPSVGGAVDTEPKLDAAPTPVEDVAIPAIADEAEADPTLGITVNEYVKRLAEVTADMGSLKVGSVEAPASDGSSTIHLGDGAAVVLSVDSDSGKVDSLTFTGDPAKNSDAFALITLAGVAVHAAFPASEGEQVKAALGEAFTGLEAGGKTREVRIGDRVVFASMAVGLGLVVGVEPADA